MVFYIEIRARSAASSLPASVVADAIGQGTGSDLKYHPEAGHRAKPAPVAVNDEHGCGHSNLARGWPSAVGRDSLNFNAAFESLSLTEPVAGLSVNLVENVWMISIRYDMMMGAAGNPLRILSG